MQFTIDDWANLLGSMAPSAPKSASERALFADEAGHRRSVDRPFLAWLNRDQEPEPEPALEDLTRSIEPDVALWASLALDRPVPDAVIQNHRANERRSSYDSGSLFPQRDNSGPIAIEVWSEVELSSLHALGWLARKDTSLRPMVRQVAAWHIENLQPDNATNHPWAVHVFATIGVLSGNDDALMYAQTLLHNCQVTLGRPDAFSALILRDASDALRHGGIHGWICQP